MKIVASMLVFSFLAAGLARAEDAPAKPAKPTSSAAVSADKEYQHAMDVAEQAYKAAKVAATKRLVEKLNTILKAATRAGDLDEANAINVRIKEAQAAVAEPAPDAEKKAPNLSTVKYSMWTTTDAANKWSIWLSAGGDCVNDHGNRGGWTQTEKTIQVTLPKGSRPGGSCVFTLSDDGKELAGTGEKNEHLSAHLVGTNLTNVKSPP